MRLHTYITIIMWAVYRSFWMTWKKEAFDGIYLFSLVFHPFFLRAFALQIEIVLINPMALCLNFMQRKNCMCVVLCSVELYQYHIIEPFFRSFFLDAPFPTGRLSRWENICAIFCAYRFMVSVNGFPFDVRIALYFVTLDVKQPVCRLDKWTANHSA